MIELTYDKALDLLKDAITLRGEDYVYEKISGGCKYVHGGGKSCIVGHVLVDLGVDVDALEWGHLRSSYAAEVLSALESDGILEATPEAASLLARVQRYQDNEVPWGRALERALAGFDWASDTEA